MAIFLTDVVSSLHAKSQPDTAHGDPIHYPIILQKIIFSVFFMFPFFLLGNRGRDPSTKMRREKSCILVVGNLKFPI